MIILSISNPSVELIHRTLTGAITSDQVKLMAIELEPYHRIQFCICCILAYTIYRGSIKDIVFLKHMDGSRKRSSSERTLVSSKANFGRNTNSVRLITIVGL